MNSVFFSTDQTWVPKFNIKNFYSPVITKITPWTSSLSQFKLNIWKIVRVCDFINCTTGRFLDFMPKCFPWALTFFRWQVVYVLNVLCWTTATKYRRANHTERKQTFFSSPKKFYFYLTQTWWWGGDIRKQWKVNLPCLKLLQKFYSQTE